MTDVTFKSRNTMPCWQGMAAGTGTGTQHLTVVYRCNGHPGRCPMTGITHIGAGDVITRFTGSCTAIMATDTGAYYLAVINGYNRYPDIG